MPRSGFGSSFGAEDGGSGRRSGGRESGGAAAGRAFESHPGHHFICIVSAALEIWLGLVALDESGERAVHFAIEPDAAAPLNVRR